jgi:hypothetical protein
MAVALLAGLTAQAVPYPGPGAPVLPTRLEAENYNQGGEGIGYHDNDASNNGGQYRPAEGVDIENCSEGGYNVGWTNGGEWLAFDVNVPALPGYDSTARYAYDVTARYAGTSNASAHLEVGGLNAGSFSMPSTGNWQAWSDSNVVSGVLLEPGTQELRFVADSSGFNLNALDFAFSAVYTPNWYVENIDDTATNPSNANFIDLARNPDGTPTIRTEMVFAINYKDSPGANSGQFRGNNGFPESQFLNEIATGNEESWFLQRHTGFIEIPVAGPYSLQNTTDDPFFVQIGTQSGPVSWTDTSCCNNQQTVLMLDNGIFPIEVIMAEFTGGDHVEFSMAYGEAAPGVPLPFSTGTYHLVGDVAHGGLAIHRELPEPATLSLLGLGLLAVARRRRR